MAALSFADLLKELPGTTIPRWTVLVNKIQKKEDLKLNLILRLLILKKNLKTQVEKPPENN